MKAYSYLYGAAAMLGIFFSLSSCENLSIDEVSDAAPTISSFSPLSGPAGSVIVITGEHLNAVNKAVIGEVEVEISEKVSPSRLSVRVGKDVTSGRITLYNSIGSGVSEASFTCTLVVPSLTASLLQASAEMGEEILVAGTGLGAVTSVRFTSDGYENGHEATIISATDEELVLKVPYVEGTAARITLGYFDGSATVYTPLAGAPSIEVIKYVPKFDAVTLGRTAVGKSVTLTGENLGNIEKVMVGDWEAVFFKESGKLSFTVPAGDFQDGDTSVPLTVWFFAGNESIVIAEDFTVFVPFVKFWENVIVWAQGRTEKNEYVSFFSPENGKAYENAKWKDVLDPVALKYTNSQWNEANNPKPGVVSDEEYDSVLPYFFISAVSGNVLQLNSPANSNSQLKNFFISFSGTPANDYRVPGGNTTLPGTPILAFRYLNPEASSAAERDLVAKVKAGEIENINEALFPVNVEENTIAGISVSSFAGGLKSSAWCDHQTEKMADEDGYKPDAVLLVAYYRNNGYIKSNPAANIKRLGILHITGIDWGVYNNSNYGGSRISFNCYWQKYDYDYTKI